MNEYEYDGTCGFQTTLVDGVRVHTFSGSTGQVYNTTQTSDRIHDGDVLVVPKESVVGFLLETWPCAVTERHGDLHGLIGGVREFLLSEDGPRYTESVKVALAIASE